MHPPRPLQPGDPLPEVRLEAVNRDGAVSLADFRDRTPLLVGLFRGLECPFCRRQIAQLGTAHDRLRAAGVEPLAVIATPRERAAQYLRYRPTPLTLLADPERHSHQAFGLPTVEIRLDAPDGGAAGGEPAVAHGNQLVGHFLADRRGIVRWTHVEGAATVRGASFPGLEELIAAARAAAG